MERGIVSGQHGDAPYDGLELVRLTLPRRVYTQEHLAYVADVVEGVHRRADEVPGLAFTYEPEHLRFFLGRFEPTAPYPDLALRDPGTPARVAVTRSDLR
jgi:tryptophanase